MEYIAENGAHKIWTSTREENKSSWNVFFRRFCACESGVALPWRWKNYKKTFPKAIFRPHSNHKRQKKINSRCAQRMGKTHIIFIFHFNTQLRHFYFIKDEAFFLRCFLAYSECVWNWTLSAENKPRREERREKSKKFYLPFLPYSII